jgi:hypothetical protein
MTMIHNSPAPISFSNYVEATRFGAAYCLPVAQQLHTAMPPDASSDEKSAMKVVLERAELVKEAITDRERVGPARVRPMLLDFANAWSACAEILGGLARIEGQKGDEARVLSDAVFADGVAFVQLDARAAWGEGQRRLDRVADDALAKRLEAVVGKHVAVEMKRSTDALGAAIGVGAHHEVPNVNVLGERVSSFARGVAAYARVLAARVDEDDVTSVSRFLAAMAPLDAHRASRRGTSEEPAPSEPTTSTTSDTPVNGAPQPPIAAPGL